VRERDGVILALKRGLESCLNGLDLCGLGCRAASGHSRGNHFLGIMPYDNRLECSECSAIACLANVYAE
jgi:hypothetical protein